MTLAKATAEVVWLQKLLSELGFPQPHSTTIYSDSLSAIVLSENPKFYSRSKHVKAQYHYTQEKELDKQIQLKYVFTLNMTTDIFTKPLLRNKHNQCIQNLGMCLNSQDHIVPKYQPLITFHIKHLFSSMWEQTRGQSQRQKFKQTCSSNIMIKQTYSRNKGNKQTCLSHKHIKKICSKPLTFETEGDNGSFVWRRLTLKPDYRFHLKRR